MSVIKIAEFETKTMGTAEVYRGHDEKTRDMLYEGAFHPGIVATLGTKDQVKRFSPEKFPGWVQKNGGRALYTARIGGNLAGTVWLGHEEFPEEHFPDAEFKPPYTIAFRTEYSTPDGGTYGKQGIAKRLGLVSLIDYAELTKDGGPMGLPPLTKVGDWLDTGVENFDGQALYHHIGNTARGEEPLGYVDVGVYYPEPKPDGATEESRVGMVITPATLDQVIAIGRTMVDYVG
jgi:hypothetical protein